MIRGEDKHLINFINIDWTLQLEIDITRKYIISDKSNEMNIQNDLDLLTYN